MASFEQAKENLWNQVLIALDSDDESRVITLSRKLADMGDWRGSNTLGYIFEKKATRAALESGHQDRENYQIAADWYKRALTQEEQFASHYGLANYYYYGLGGKYNFVLAYEHLKHCVEFVPIAKLMMAELLFLGLGVSRDLESARKLFMSDEVRLYPASIIGLSRIEKAEGRFVNAAFYYFLALYKAIKLVFEKKNHPLLAGIGGKYRTIRRDRLDKTKETAGGIVDFHSWRKK